MRLAPVAVLVAVLVVASPAHAASWAKPVAPVVPGADGYVAIPGAAIMPQKTRVYRAIYDATRFADTPTGLVPALNMAGSELNVLGGAGIPVSNAKFVVVFHGPSVDGILDDAHYRAKYHFANPNLAVIRDMKRAGVKFFVCGQHLAFSNIDPATITKDVVVASDALIVLMTYQADGYALMSF
jgi:intracellular sulfur oxidation DsrE/DsrF family protein